jgi:hypothetical protein
MQAQQPAASAAKSLAVGLPPAVVHMWLAL